MHIDFLQNTTIEIAYSQNSSASFIRNSWTTRYSSSHQLAWQVPYIAKSASSYRFMIEVVFLIRTTILRFCCSLFLPPLLPPRQ